MAGEYHCGQIARWKWSNRRETELTAQSVSSFFVMFRQKCADLTEVRQAQAQLTHIISRTHGWKAAHIQVKQALCGSFGLCAQKTRAFLVRRGFFMAKSFQDKSCLFCWCFSKMNSKQHLNLNGTNKPPTQETKRERPNPSPFVRRFVDSHHGKIG